MEARMNCLTSWLHDKPKEDISDTAKKVLMVLRNEWNMKSYFYSDINDKIGDFQLEEECISDNARLFKKTTVGSSNKTRDFEPSRDKRSPINDLSSNLSDREEQFEETVMSGIMNNDLKSFTQIELTTQQKGIDCLTSQSHGFNNKDMILSGNITQEEIQEADDILADCSYIFDETEYNSDVEYYEQAEILTFSKSNELTSYLKQDEAKKINSEKNERHLHAESFSNTFARNHLPELNFASPLGHSSNNFNNEEYSQISASDNNFESELSINNNINDQNVKFNNLTAQQNSKKSNCCTGTPTKNGFNVLKNENNTFYKGKVNNEIKRNSINYYFSVKSKYDSSIKKQEVPQNNKKNNLLKQMNIKTMFLKANKKLDETNVLFPISGHLRGNSKQINKREKSYSGNKIHETQLPRPKALFSERKTRNYNAKGHSSDTYILYLNEEEILKFENKLKTMRVYEIVITLTYRQGFCDLNKTDTTLVLDPSGLMIGLFEEEQRRNFFYLSLEESKCTTFDTAKKLISTLFTSSCKKVCFCAQNLIKQIMKTFGFQGKDVALRWIFFDPMIGSWLLNPDKPIMSFYQISEDFGIKVPEKIKKTHITADYSDQTYKLLMILSEVAELMFHKLSDRNLWNLFNELETRLVSILAVMELQGMCINIQQLKGIGNIMKEQIEKIENMAYETVGKKFQISSTCQLRHLLYGELKLDEKHGVQIQTTVTHGFKSTSESMLRCLELVHPLPGLVLEYRHLQKIKSTYVDGILQHILGGMIYTSWNQVSAATGRIISKNPNLQCIPKKPVLLKNIGNTKLLPRLPFHSHVGYTLVAADFKHIELRLLANFSKDNLLITAFQKPGDIFVHLSKVWLDKSEDEITPENREQTKKIVYSVMYGIGSSKLSEYLHITISEAEKIINKFLACFPAIRKFSRDTIRQCQEKGFMSTVGGRQRIFPNINSLNQKLRAYSERQAINFIIQGSAADVCKWAIINISEELAKYSNIDVNLLLQIHDELVWEVNDDHVEETIGIINKVLNENKTICGYDFPVCLPVLITSGKNWSDMKDRMF